jgi:Bacterial protein of unknown function (DUF899)
VFYNFKTQQEESPEREGVSAFYKDPDGKVSHTYSTYARGIDLLNTAYNYLEGMIFAAEFDIWLFVVAHRGRKGNPDQYPFWIYESADSLAPRFFLIFEEHSTALRFKFSRGSLDVIHIEFKPSLRNRHIIWPGITAKTRLRCLRERPESKMLCAVESIRMKITAVLLFKRNPEGVSVELAACDRIMNYRTKARDKQNFQFLSPLHTISSSWNQRTAS